MPDKTVWRECESAGGIGRNPIVRYCRALRRRTGWVNCNVCPIPEQKRKSDLWDKCGPALVEAVQAAKEFVNSDEAQAAFTLQGVHGGCVPWRKDGKLIGEILDAALALLPKARAAKAREKAGV